MLMNDYYCINYSTCKFINEEIIDCKLNSKDYYLEKFCTNQDLYWKNCKRYQVKNELGFCPDFIFPETELTLDEIIDKIDQNFN